jgi:muconolactone delta-isomerase
MHDLQNMKATAIKVLGKEAERMNEVWGLDEEGEVKAMWRASGHRESATLRSLYLLTSSNF